MFVHDKPHATSTGSALAIDVAHNACAEYPKSAMMARLQCCVWFLMCALVVTSSTSCTTSKTRSASGEEAVASTSSNPLRSTTTTTTSETKAPSCGSEVQTHGAGYNETARTCLWDAYRAGQDGEFITTRHTIEGDPITLTLRVRAGSAIEVLEDNRDRFGSSGVRTSSCKVLERSPPINGRSGFVLRGCRGSAETIEVP